MFTHFEKQVSGGVAQQTLLAHDAPLGAVNVAFRRALKHSFGSVCFASLLVPMTSMVYLPCTSVLRKGLSHMSLLNNSRLTFIGLMRNEIVIGIGPRV